MTATAAQLLPAPAAVELAQREADLAHQAAELSQDKAALEAAFVAARESVRAFSRSLDALHALKTAILKPQDVADVREKIAKEVISFSRMGTVARAGADVASIGVQPLAAIFVSECCAAAMPAAHQRVIDAASDLRAKIAEHSWDVERLVSESLETSGVKNSRLPISVVRAFLNPHQPLPPLEELR